MSRISHVSDASFLAAIRETRGRFGPAACRAKLALLRRADRAPLHRAALLRDYHEWLLFLATYPDDETCRATAEKELRRLATLVGSTPRLRRGLRNSGIANSDASYAFSIDFSTWLSARFGRDVELEWEEGSAGDALDEFLPRLALRVERDGLLNEDYSTQEWLRLARGRRRGSTALAWLAREFERLTENEFLREQAWDALELHLAWRLHGSIASRTRCRFPPRRLQYHPDGLQRSVDVPAQLRQSMTGAPPLPRRAALRMIDMGRAVLAVRGRETDPLAYANPGDVRLVRLERGVDVAIYGMRPARRLPLESFFGFIAARNRVPVGYGGGWVWGGRCEIGVNIFDTFRGGESAMIFAQVMRVYHRLFRVWRFLVDPFQFGAGNREAIQSGAFWFYHRLGFRPIEPALRQLADEERARIATDAGYRTPAPRLRRLASARLIYEQPEGHIPRIADPGDLTRLGIAATRWIGRRFGGDRAAAQRHCSAAVARRLGVRVDARRRPAEHRAFEEFSVLAAMIPDLRRWSRAERRALAEVMAAKGAARESDYARLLQNHPRLLDAIGRLSKRG